MHRADFVALGPLILLAATAAAVMLLIAFRRSHAATAGLTLAGLAAAFAALPAASRWASLRVTPLLIVDRYGTFFVGLVLAATAVTALLAYDYLQRQDGHREEFYLLLLLAALGSAVLVMSRHFAALFLGLELLSVSLYALVAYLRLRARSIEAGIKYLVLAAASAAFLLFGLALAYAHSGTLDFFRMAAQLKAAQDQGGQMILLAGMGMLVVGIGFKLAVVPFHMWTPDVYQGAPAPVTAFVATVSKGAVAVLLVRLIAPAHLSPDGALFTLLAVVAFASMVAGNLLALLQKDVKRILAYSSIAHMGYLLVAVLAGGEEGVAAVAFYLAAYSVTTLGAFGVIGALSGKGQDADNLEDFRGLFSRHPWVAGVFTAMLLSLAGIPLTAGFVGKFTLVAAGVQTKLWWLVITLVLTSGIGLFYYLRVVIALFSEPSEPTEPNVASAAQPSIWSPEGLVLAVLAILLIWLGVVPAGFMDFIASMVG